MDSRISWIKCHVWPQAQTDSDCPFGIFKLFLRICWIVPKKYLLNLDQTILLHFRSSIDRPLNLHVPQYPGSNNYFSIPEEKIIIINNWGLMKIFYFGWSGVYFIFILHLYITVTCRHTIVLLRQRLLLKYQNVI